MSAADAIAEFQLLRKPTPLATLVYIYNASYPDAYTNYMEGAKALAKYLAPIEVFSNPFPAVPTLHRTYALVELAKAIQPHTKHPLSTTQIENAIYAYSIS